MGSGGIWHRYKDWLSAQPHSLIVGRGLPRTKVLSGVSDHGHLTHAAFGAVLGWLLLCTVGHVDNPAWSALRNRADSEQSTD